MLKSLSMFKRRFFLANVDVVLIASSGRTGTQFFETLFKHIDHTLLVAHEPKPDLFDSSVEKIRKQATKKTIQDYIVFHRGKLLLKHYGLWSRLTGKKITYVESNPFVYPILEEYKSVFKSVNVIYIARNPKTYLISAYNKDPRFDGKNNFYADTDKRKRLTAADFNEMSQETWTSLSRIERIAWYWNKCNEILYEYTQRNQTTSLSLKFEDVFSEDLTTKSTTLKKILNFSGLNVTEVDSLIALFETKVNKSKQLSDASSFDDFSAKEQELIHKFIAPMSNKLQYK